MSALHLTEDQLDDHLIGDLAAEAAAHLAGCAFCQTRVREAEAPIANFREMSLSWGERRSATMPVPAVAGPRSRRSLGWLTAAITVTAALVIGIAVPLSRHDAGESSEARADVKSAISAPLATPKVSEPLTTTTLAAVGHTGMKSVTPVAASPAQIAQDNQMLAAIDRELDAPRENADAFGLVQAAVSSGRIGQ